MAANLTYLPPVKLRNIEWALAQIDRNHVPGAVLEAGIALGGSAILIAKTASDGRSFHGYDVFDMIPPPSPEDSPEVHERYAIIASGASGGLGGETYYGYREDLYADVVAAFERFGQRVDNVKVSLHKGLFEDTLIPQGPIAFAHIDCDWYEPVHLCLERIYPSLQPGGFLIGDDYYNYASAARAFDEFLAEHSDLEVLKSRSRHHIVLRRT